MGSEFAAKYYKNLNILKRLFILIIIYYLLNKLLSIFLYLFISHFLFFNLNMFIVVMFIKKKGLL